MTCSSNTTCRPDTSIPIGRVWRGLAACAALLCALALPGAATGSAGPDDLIAQARQDLARNDGIAAEARLNQALSLGASRPVVAAWMGWAMITQGEPERARPWVSSGRFTRDSAVDGYRALALVEIEDGDLRAAGRVYDRALEFAPRNATLWSDIARLRYRGGEHLQAIEASDYALELDPNNVRALELRAQLVRDRAGLAPALQWFDKAYRLAPHDLSVLGEYAATAGDMGLAKRMLELTRAMLKLDPENPRAYYLQAVMAARAGNYRLGRVLMNKIGGRMNDVPAAMLLDGVLELGAGNYTLAVEALEPLVRRQPGNEKARNLLARALFLAGEHRYLTDNLAGLARRPDSSPYLQAIVGRSFEILGERDKAAPLLDSAAQWRNSPVRPVAGVNRVGNLLALGEYSQAEAVAADWLAENATYYDSLAASGDVQLARGNAGAALAYYARAARIRMPESLMARRFQAMLDIGDPDSATALAETFLSANPTSDTAMRLVGWAAARSGDWRRARLLLENARANGGRRDVALLTNLTLAQLRTGDAEAAVATAREAYRLQRANPVAAQTLGLALAQAGQDPVAAAALLAKARTMLGDTPLLAEALRKLREAA